MNLGLRAILYTVRKWKKTLLVFCLILSISTLVLSGLAIADAQEEQTEEVRGTTGASFTVQRDISTGGWSSGSGGSYSTQEFMTEDMIRRRFLQHTGIYDRGHDPGDCLGGRHPGI